MGESIKDFLLALRALAVDSGFEVIQVDQNLNEQIDTVDVTQDTLHQCARLQRMDRKPERI